MALYDTIKLATADGIAHITLNRPATRNAISKEMRLELKDAMDAVEADDSVRLAIIKGEGKAFSAGTDLSQGLAGFNTIEEQLQAEYRPVIMAVVESQKPYIASIHGPCAGIGASLALACDLAIMADDAFLYPPFGGLSLVTDGGMAYHLVRNMGYKKAYQAFLESQRISAEECLKYDLVNKVVPATSLADETKAWAKSLVSGAPLSQKYGKHIMRQAGMLSFGETFDLEAKMQATCFASEDFQAATEAFFAKKKPVFKGK